VVLNPVGVAEDDVEPRVRARRDGRRCPEVAVRRSVEQREERGAALAAGQHVLSNYARTRVARFARIAGSPIIQPLALALAPGLRLGAYEVIAQIGAGGMGEVYKAHDTKLNRDVALKILPEAFTLDVDRIARFRREAQMLAALNHPNIAAIYGFEDSGSTHALVLELVEGPTLADRIAKRPIPLDEALPIAKQIAEALEAAHEQGIIHRDLKPANIKLRDDGTVKVLDFGLAKAMEPASAISPSLTASPTITTPAQMTGVGMILGTAAYMSPEQAKGRPADKRSDVWAFGCVLFEMVAARRPFDGEDIAETLASVLKAEPDWKLLPSALPQSVRTLIHACLTKERTKRIADISTALFVLADRDADPMEGVTPAKPGWRTALLRAGVVLLAALAGAAGAWVALRPEPPRVSVLSLVTDPAHALTIGNSRPMAISRDGRRIAYVGPNDSLMLRSLDQLEPTVLTQAGGPQVGSPAFSPDGAWVGYFDANNRLLKVQANGGPSTVISGLDGGNQGGMTWLPDGSIVFATQNRQNGLLQTVPGTNTFKVLTTPNRKAGEADHLWPEALPGGRGVLFTIFPVTGAPGDAQTAVYDLRTGTYKMIVPGASHAHYVRSGHLVYSVNGALRTMAFDLDRLEPVGRSTAQNISVMATAEMAAGFDVSANGTLVYVPGAGGRVDRELKWVGRDGQEESTGLPSRQYLYPRISFDGTRVLLDIRDQDNDIWLWDIRRGTLTNLTRNPALDRYPVWLPDGNGFVFSSERDGGSAIYRQSVDGQAERLTAPTPHQQATTAVSRDGKYVLFDLFNTQLKSVTLDSEHRIAALPNTGSGVRPALSADGQWLAYSSNESGRFEIFVQAFPASTGRRQVSADGGVEPWWSPRGNELFYFTLSGTLMSVQVNTLADLSRPSVAVEPKSWIFQSNGTAAAYDVAADGRVLMVKAAGGGQSGAPQLVVVQNWLETLKAGSSQ
jgi:eukaryotic-like serine/threonine-protein kinase